MSGKVLIIAALFCILTLSGCGGTLGGKFQEIAVTSNPSDIEVVASTGNSCYTPGSLNLRRNKNHVLYATYLGQTQKKTVRHGLDLLFFGRSLFGGGPINSAFDVAGGSCDSLKPDEVHFDFTKESKTKTEKPPATNNQTIAEINEIAENIRNIK